MADPSQLRLLMEIFNRQSSVVATFQSRLSCGLPVMPEEVRTLSTGLLEAIKGVEILSNQLTIANEEYQRQKALEPPTVEYMD